MKKLRLLTLLILFCACENSSLETSSSATYNYDGSNDEASIYEFDTKVLLEELTKNEMDLVVEIMQDNGVEGRYEDLHYIVQASSIVVTAIMVRWNEMPESLRNSNGDWVDVASKDDEASQFITQLQSDLIEVLPDADQTTRRCDAIQLIMTIFSCFLSETAYCITSPYNCVYVHKLNLHAMIDACVAIHCINP